MQPDPSAIVIRPTRASDLPALGKLAGGLVRQHHSFDPQRFFLEEPVEPGYANWLGKESKREGAVVLTAERAGQVVGYVYATTIERDWSMLLDFCGAIHDVFVDERERRSGVATLLIEAAVTELKKLGAPRIVLSTAARNEAAQKFFERLGFRRTMVEFTRET